MRLCLSVGACANGNVSCIYVNLGCQRRGGESETNESKEGEEGQFCDVEAEWSGQSFELDKMWEKRRIA